MRIHRRWIPALLLALSLPAASGCTNCRPARPECTSAYQPCDRCAAAPTRVGFPPATLGPSGPVVPGPIVSAPPARPAAPMAPLPPGPSAAPPAAVPPASAEPTPTWKPATPEPGRPQEPEADPAPSVRLYGPERLRPIPSTPQNPAAPPVNIPPAAPEKPADPGTTPSAFPVDIPQFVSVKDQIAAGHKPRPDGFTWLKDRGYKTVLHLKAPGEDDAAARRLVESKGLVYRSLEVSPEAIKQGLGEQFDQLLSAKDNLPLFVYDRDGSLAGPVWFLHLRLTERLSREKALEELSRLGYKLDEDGPQKELWLAVQSLLSMGQGSSRLR